MNLNVRNFVLNEVLQRQKAGEDERNIVTELSNDLMEQLTELHVLTAPSEELAVSRYDGLIDRLLDNRQHARQLWRKCDKMINADKGRLS